MTPYVRMQNAVIDLLFYLHEYDKQKFHRLVGLCKQSVKYVPQKWEAVMCKLGLSTYKKERWWCSEINYPELILEQIGEDGETILDLLGSPISGGDSAFGLEEWPRNRGMSIYFLRTEYGAQPKALKPGDILMTGERVLCHPRKGGDGVVLIKLSGGNERGRWRSYSDYSSIAFLPNSSKAPPNYIV